MGLLNGDNGSHVIDHIDRNPGNNQRNNLRATVEVDSKQIHLGYFSTPLAASKAYQKYISTSMYLPPTS